MKQIFNVTLVLLFSVLLSACASLGFGPKPAPVVDARPVWIENPGKGVSASAGFHIGGKVAQEELAVLRGRTEFAKRFGVSIQSEQNSLTTATDNRASTISAQNTRENTDQTGVKVMVKEKWRDTENDVLWVWLVPSDK
jgi:hypothetical protein